MSSKPIRSALVSVFHKENLKQIAEGFKKHNITVYSTGGTQKKLEEFGVKVHTVEDLTGYPSILGGRVKTLHPLVFGGILSRRDHIEDVNDMAGYGIPEIDLVIVDLYPFEDTVASSASHQDIIEKIDIGGISLIRAAAKNYNEVVVVPSSKEYSYLVDKILNSGSSTEEQRLSLAAKAFSVSRNYDTLISSYLSEKSGNSESKTLRYGENPHQAATFNGDLGEMFEIVQEGKSISYNNLLDIDAAVDLISDFKKTSLAVLKHNNACGFASRENVLEAWTEALAGDPISAFGGIIICNSSIDLDTAKEINKLFYEVLIAKDYSEDAIDELSRKKNRIVLKLKQGTQKNKIVRTVLNGTLVQDADIIIEDSEELNFVSEAKANAEMVNDLLFASKLVKHTKSNAIVLAKHEQLIASGTGQTSRIDALQQAIDKAKKFGLELEGAVMASDAFFPFPDCVELAAQNGIKGIIQPGGSKNDQASIDAANKFGVAMCTTGRRHFKH